MDLYEKPPRPLTWWRSGKPRGILPSASSARGLRAAVFALLLLAAALALNTSGGAEPAHAQDSDVGMERVLYSTLGQTTAPDSTSLAASDAYTEIRTGSHGSGYVITSVDLKFAGPANSASDLPSIALLSPDGITEAFLTGSPADLGDNTYAFTPNTPFRVGVSSPFSMLIEGGTLTLAQTTANSQDDIAAGGWLNLTTGMRSYNSIESPTTISGRYQFRVRGRVVQPGTAYISNIALSDFSSKDMKNNDRAQSFTTGNDDAGYPLHSVQAEVLASGEQTSINITIREGSPSGAKVADLPKPSSVTAPDYFPDPPVTLAASTTYWLVAEAGTGIWYETGQVLEPGTAAGWSFGSRNSSRTAGTGNPFVDNPAAAVLQIRINGPPSNTPAAGQPAITAPVAFRVPSVLAVDLTGITDTDGAEDIAPTATYRWQRFSGDGVTQEDANIGTDPTYTLTEADAGKTIKVAVSFEDDSGFSEGPLTSNATEVIGSAGQCPEPELQGGATLIEGPRRIGVGQYTSGTTTYYGYIANTDDTTLEPGTLDDNTFATATTPEEYTITEINKSNTTLRFRLDKALAATDKQSLALHICGDHYALSDFAGANPYTLPSSQDWSAHAERTFYITEDLVDPTFLDATVDGTSLVMRFSEKLRQASSLSHSSFSVTKGVNDDTVTVSNTTPTISGNTVEITLSSAITASDTNIKVSYSKPNSGSGNRVADLVGRDAAGFSSQSVANIPADSAAPRLAQSNPPTLDSDGKTLTLTMNEAMRTYDLPAATDFTVVATPDGGSRTEVPLDADNPVTVTGSTVALNLATLIAHNDTNVRVSYDASTGDGRLRDRVGFELRYFTNLPVINNSAIPRISIESLHPDASPVIAWPRFRFTASTAPGEDIDLNLELAETADIFEIEKSVETDAVTFPAQSTTFEAQTVDFVGNINEINTDGIATVTILGGDDHLPALPPHNSATVEGKLPPTGPTVWLAHEQLAYSATEGEPFSIGIVFNAGEGVAQPRETFTIALLTEEEGTATINQDYEHISFNVPATPEDWTATPGGGYTYTSNQAITIIDDDLYEPETETFNAYMKSSQGVSNRLVIPDRNDQDGWVTITITNTNPLGILEIEPTSTPTNGYYGVGDVITFRVRFSGKVTVADTGVPHFGFIFDRQARKATYSSGSGTRDLVFSYTVTTDDRDDHNGISWPAAEVRVNEGFIRFVHEDESKRAYADVSHDAGPPLPDHKVDTQKPQRNLAGVSGSVLTLSYSENLKSTAPANSAFTVSVDGEDGVNPTNVAIAGNIVSLTLASAIDQGQTATVSYTKPAQDANPLQDLSGKEADSFSNVTATDTMLVSNLAEASHPTDVLQAGNTFGTLATQGFHTGDHDGGYQLTEVGVFIAQNNFIDSETAILKIYDSDTDGTPKDELYTLATPTLTEGSTAFFTAPAGAKLEPDTDYHVAFQATGLFPSVLQLAITDSDSQTGKTNWGIEDAFRTNESLTGAGRAVKMGIHGYENNAATGEPTVSGEPSVGLSLTANPSAIMDADGLEKVTYTYQWVRVDDDGESNPTPITGETGNSYTLTAADEGKRVRVKASFTDDNSVPEERTSDAYPATGTVIDDALVSNLDETTPGFVFLVGSRSGTTTSQGFGTGDHGGGYRLTGVSAIIDSNNFTGSETATFKIYDSDTDGTPKDELYTLVTPALTRGNTVFFTAPEGAKLEPTTDYHVVFQGTGDETDDLSLRLTASDSQTGKANWSIEDALRLNESHGRRGFAVKTSIHGYENNAATGEPTVSGKPIVGQTLTAHTDAIMDEDGLENVGYSYQWVRVDDDGASNATPITGETDDSYTLTAADDDKRLRVRVSFTDDNSIPEERTSNAYPAAGTVRCLKPDLRGGANLIEGPRRIGVASYTASTTDYHGYRDILPRQEGTLDDDTFSTTATPAGYTIEAIEKTLTSIWLNLDKALAAADKQSLALHVCGDHYALSDFTLSAGSGHGYFIRSEQDWSILTELTFHITEDLVNPSFVDATVDGTSLVIAFNEKLRQAPNLDHNRFSVTKGVNDDSVTVTNVGPTISGNTVEINLSEAITASDTNIKVSYSKPNSGTQNRVADLVGNEAATFRNQPVTNILADPGAPALASTNTAVLQADGRTLTLTMNEPMRTFDLPSDTDFTVVATPAGGSQTEVLLNPITPVTVTGSAVALNLGTLIAHNDTNVKVSYAAPASGGKLQDRAGNALPSFTDQTVINNSAIPRISIESLHPDASPVIANPRFRFTASTAPSQDLELNLELQQTADIFDIETVTIPAQDTAFETQTVDFVSTINQINTDSIATVTILGGDDHLPAVPPHNSATVEGKLPPTGPTVWLAHEQLAYSATEGEPFSIGIVFNAGEGVAQPRESIAISLLTEDDGTATINQDYDHISRNVHATPSDWTSTSGGGYTYTSNQDINIIDDELYEPDVETFNAYMKSSQGVSDQLVFPDRNDSDGWVTISITNLNPLGVLDIEPTSTPPNDYYDDTDVITFKITFSGNVSVDTTNGVPQFGFILGEQFRQATYSTGSDTRELVFSYTVTTMDQDDHDGISWPAASLVPNGGIIKFMHQDESKQVRADLYHDAGQPLSNHKVDTQKPQLEYAEVDGSDLKLSYSEDLKTTAPPNNAFTVSVDGEAAVNPTNVVITGNTVTLTLTSAVGKEQTATVSYTKPGASSNPLQDLSGKETDSFNNVPVDQASGLVNYRATPGDRQVLLEWDQLINSDLTRYQYRYMSTADAAWNPDWTDIPDSNASTTSFTAQNLTNGIEYTLQVRPVYTINDQDQFGNEGRVKSTPRGALAAPTQLTATSSRTGEITLSWADPNDVTITGYQYRYQTPSDTGWNPDWQDIPGSNANTTSHTLSNLAWQVLHTFELRAMRGSTAGPPSSQAQGTPLGDTTAPSEVRELRAVVHSNSRIQLYFRAPARPGDAPVTGFEYRYADSNPVPETVPWQTASSTQASSRTIYIPDLHGDTLYTFEVRAVNGNGKQGAIAQVQARTTATPVITTPSAPQSLTTTPGTPYTDLVDVDDPFSDKSLPARMAFVDVTLQWEPAADHGNSVIHYVYRFAEGNSVPPSDPWLFATSYDTGDELELILSRLKADTDYTLEVATQAQNGTTGPQDAIQITTLTYEGPHYTLSAPSSADEDETFTITVSRTNQKDGESSTIVEIQGPGENDVTHLAAEFSTEDSSAAVDYKVPEDDQTTTNREIRVRIGHVGPSLENTYSVEWHTVDIENITTQ